MTVTLPAGQKLTVTADAVGTGTVRRIPDSGSTTNYTAFSIAAGTTNVFGPYANERRFDILTTTGALTYTIGINDVDPALQVITLMATNGAVAIVPGTVIFTKAGVLAATLAAPTAAQDGTIIVFTSTTANAHTITATSLIEDGVTGGSKTTATFAAFAGASITLLAYSGKWYVLSKNVVTIT